MGDLRKFAPHGTPPPGAGPVNQDIVIVEERVEDCLTIRTDPHAVERIQIFLQDSIGRRRELGVMRGTVLILAPVGELGVLAYDPVPEVDAETNKPIFRQRAILSRLDVLATVARSNGVTTGDVQLTGQGPGGRIIVP